MPRTNLCRELRERRASAPPEPPIDWLRAAMLERMERKGINKMALSKLTGIPYETIRWLLRKAPEEWKPEQRRAVCRALGIEAMLQPAGAPRIGGEDCA